MRYLGWAAWVPAMLVAGAPLLAVEVPLTVKERAGLAPAAGPVTSGIPFARGAVKDLGRLSVSAGERVLPAQFARLAAWDDGSVRWALVDTQVDVAAGGAAALVLRDDGRNAAPPQPVTVTEGPDSVALATGPLAVTIDRRHFNLFTSIRVDGKEAVGAAGRGLVLHTADGAAVPAGPPDVVRVEEVGPLRATVMLRGAFPGVHNGLLGYTVRVTAFAGKPFLKVRVWLENRGQHGYGPSGDNSPYTPEWFAFDGLAVELGLATGAAVTASSEGVQGQGAFKVLQTCRNAAKRGDPAYGYDQMHYAITGAGGELKAGDRTDGVVTLAGAAAPMTVAIRHFWQNYEKAIELKGTTLNLWLWPTEGQYPRPITGYYAPGYAEKMMQALMKKGLYNLPGSVHKGHELILDFSGREGRATWAEVSEPLCALPPAAYSAGTAAAPGLFAPPEVRTGNKECDRRLDAWTRMTASAADPASPTSIWQARRDGAAGTLWDAGFMFGWMDFGDLAVPGHGTVSLHYDWPWVTTLSFLRTGDLNFLRLADEMVRHRVEVDQDWSDRTRPEFRGLQRAGYTYAHFHCERFTGSQPTVASTWLAGVVLYYMLTGDAKAREAIERTGEHLSAAWDEAFAARNTKNYLLRSMPGDMRAVSESAFSHSALFDLTGDRAWLDKALALFNRCVIPKWQAVGPHLHQRQQIQSQDYLQEDVKYCYSIYALCELHRRTGDRKVFELLKAGCDTEFPENFVDAPLFLADLNAYVALVTGEKSYADKAAELWVQAFPMSKNPPVYLPGNSQWSRDAAMMLRTGHILQYCYWGERKVSGTFSERGT